MLVKVFCLNFNICSEPPYSKNHQSSQTPATRKLEIDDISNKTHIPAINSYQKNQTTKANNNTPTNKNPLNIRKEAQ